MSPFHRTPKAPLHEHRWLATQVYQRSIYESKEAARPYARSTNVLYVCQGCGDSRVKTLDGHWQLTDLLASSANIDIERIET